jgi:hypothetical protein
MLHQRDEVVTDIDATVGALSYGVSGIVEAFVADDHVLAFAEDYVAAAVEADYAIQILIDIGTIGPRHLFAGYGGSQEGPTIGDGFPQGSPEIRH